MKRILCVAGALTVLAWPGAARASDPIGVYAVIEKVVLEPDEQAPGRAQIWGRFSLAREAGRSYQAPAYGYLYYTLDQGKEEVCRREWADLKKLAGTGTVVGFGQSWNPDHLDRVRNPAEKAERPATYPLGQGLVRIRPNETWEPLKDLFTMPAPVTPTPASQVKPGAVTLAARNILSPTHVRAAYVFEIEDGLGTKEVSQEVAAGDKETKWSPKMNVKAGAKYRWRVWAIEGAWKGPVATSNFQGQPQP
jgi:hypothetical protein